MSKDANKPKKPKPGPDEERVKIDGEWGDAVKKALSKKRPPTGWPKPKADKAG